MSEQETKSAFQKHICLLLTKSIMEFGLLSNLVLLIERKFIDRIPQLWNDIFRKKLNHNVTEDTRYIVRELEKLQLSLIKEKFPQTIWSSLFSYGYHSFEKSLNDLCRVLKKLNKYRLSLSDLNGRGIRRAKAYLNKVVGIEIPSNDSRWNEIIYYSMLRNIIVHNSGKIDPTNTDKSLLIYVKNNDLLNINETSYLSFSSKFVLDANQTFSDYIKNIIIYFDPSYDTEFINIDNKLNEMRANV